MANAYYTPSGVPSTGSSGSSANMRAEMALIEAGFDLLPTVSGNAGAIVIVNAGATSLESSGATINAAGDITGVTLNATGDTSAGDNAAIGYTATEGLILTGQGSTNDVTIKNDADADVLTIATGTTTVALAGALTVAGTAAITGDVTLTGDLLTNADDSTAIGASGTAFSDLFLASGAVINFNAGDATVTHASNKLTFAGGDVHIADGQGLVIGHSAQLNDISGITYETQILGTGNADGGMLLGRYSADTTGVILSAVKGRGGIGDATTVVTGDDVFRIDAFAEDGTSSPAFVGRMLISTEGTIADGQTPGTIAFETANSSGSATTALTIDSSQDTTFVGQIIVDDTTDSTSGTTGSIQTDGGLGVAKNVYVTGDSGVHVSGQSDFTVSAGEGLIGGSTAQGLSLKGSGSTHDIRFLNKNSQDVMSIDTGTQNVQFEGPVNIQDTTDSTSTITGSIQTDGGLGVAKDVYIGGDLNVAGTGPHAIGGATADYIRHTIAGAFTSGGASTYGTGFLVQGQITGHTADTHIYGSYLSNTTEVNGTVTTVAQTRIDEPFITVTSGSVTNSAALWITAAATEASNNYALWVDAGDTRLDGNLNVQGTGPHAFGASVNDYISLGVGGSFTSLGAAAVAYGSQFSTALTLHSGDTTRAANVNVQGSITLPSAITVGEVASLRLVEPNITLTGGTVTSAATLLIASAPTEATNNYALWVDDGDTRLDGDVGIGGAPNSAAQTYMQGTWVSGVDGAANFYINSTHNVATGGSGSLARINGTLAEAASGTHSKIAGLYIDTLDITAAAGTTTDSASLYIEGAATEATNNYALWVDAGTTRLDGALDIPGGQIAFPATAVPSADANTLDDYEEGTWTPTARINSSTTGITYTTQIGNYVKIGRTVFCTFRLQLSSQGGLGGSWNGIEGLPFDIGTNNYASFNLGWDNMTSSLIHLQLQLIPGGKTASIASQTAAATSSGALLTAAEASDTVFMQGGFHYDI